MHLTKYGHSCVRFDDGDRSLVIDPGAFSDVAAALDGVGAVLITHEHFDHLDQERVRSALAGDPSLRLFAPSSITAGLAEFGEQVVTVAPDEAFTADGFSVRTFGGQHAVIHPQIPVIANVGYLIDGAVFHPGDSFTVPPVAVDTLLLPAQAPWSKVSEVIDYAISVRAPRVLPIHDHLVIDAYHGVLRGNLGAVAGPFGVSLESFDETITVQAQP